MAQSLALAHRGQAAAFRSFGDSKCPTRGWLSGHPAAAGVARRFDAAPDRSHQVQQRQDHGDVQMIASILRAWQPQATLATEGNLNNDIGLPLTLLRLRGQSHRAVGVVEVGTNHPGEIAYHR